MKRGFTLVEIITVLLIMSIGIGLFYLVLYTNWISFEKQLSLIDLQMEADLILDRIAFDGKFASQFTVAADQKNIILSFLDGSSVTYTLTSTGQITRTDSNSGSAFVMARNIDFTPSSFQTRGSYFEITLVLTDDVLGSRVALNVATQIMPRNLL